MKGRGYKMEAHLQQIYQFSQSSPTLTIASTGDAPMINLMHNILIKPILENFVYLGKNFFYNNPCENECQKN